MSAYSRNLTYQILGCLPSSNNPCLHIVEDVRPPPVEDVVLIHKALVIKQRQRNRASMTTDNVNRNYEEMHGIKIGKKLTRRHQQKPSKLRNSMLVDDSNDDIQEHGEHETETLTFSRYGGGTRQRKITKGSLASTTMTSTSSTDSEEPATNVNRFFYDEELSMLPEIEHDLN